MAVAAMLAGCVSYTTPGVAGAPGVRHVFGLVVIVLDGGDATRPAMTSNTSLGLGLRLKGAEPGLTLGYGRETLLTLPDNSCVDIDRPGPCAGRTAAPNGPALPEKDKP